MVNCHGSLIDEVIEHELFEMRKPARLKQVNIENADGLFCNDQGKTRNCFDATRGMIGVNAKIRFFIREYSATALDRSHSTSVGARQIIGLAGRWGYMPEGLCGYPRFPLE